MSKMRFSKTTYDISLRDGDGKRREVESHDAMAWKQYGIRGGECSYREAGLAYKKQGYIIDHLPSGDKISHAWTYKQAREIVRAIDIVVGKEERKSRIQTMVSNDLQLMDLIMHARENKSRYKAYKQDETFEDVQIEAEKDLEDAKTYKQVEDAAYKYFGGRVSR